MPLFALIILYKGEKRPALDTDRALEIDTSIIESGDCVYFALAVKQNLNQGIYTHNGSHGTLRVQQSKEEEPNQVILDSSARSAFEIQDKETYKFGETSWTLEKGHIKIAVR